MADPEADDNSGEGPYDLSPSRPYLFPYGPTTHRGHLMKRGIGGSREQDRRETADKTFIKTYDTSIGLFADRINALRIDGGHTLEYMAELLGISMQSFSDRVHKRTKFELAEAIFLSAFFHVSIHDMLAEGKGR